MREMMNDSEWEFLLGGPETQQYMKQIPGGGKG